MLSGYRHVSLRNEVGQPLAMPALFVFITVKDYVPDDLSGKHSGFYRSFEFVNNFESSSFKKAVSTLWSELSGKYNII